MICSYYFSVCGAGDHRVRQLKYVNNHINSGFETHLSSILIMNFTCPEIPKPGWPLRSNFLCPETTVPPKGF